MSLLAFRGAVELGLIYSLVAMGIFMSYRVLDVADLTVDGSFTMGAAVGAVCTLAGHPLLALPAAMLAGALAGFVTALLQTKLAVQPILAGIITMTALYSVNLRIMGRSNIPLLGQETLYSIAGRFLPPPYGNLVLLLLIVGVVGVCLRLFLATQLGLAIRATGDNPDMVRTSSINPHRTKTVGLCIANAIVALSGALLAPYQLFADISMGIGMVVMGLASLIIGEVVVGRSSIGRNIAAVLVGSVVYRVILAFALTASVPASDLKLLSAVVVAAAISYPAIKRRLELARLRREAGRNA